MKIRNKIALVFTLLTGTVLLLLSSFVYVVTLGHIHDNFFIRLNTRVSIAAEIRYADVHGEVLAVLRERHLQRLPGETEMFFDNERTSPSLISALPELPVSFSEDLLSNGSGQYHVGFWHYSAIAYRSDSGEHVVLLKAFDESGAEQAAFLRSVLVVGFFTSCLVVFGIGRLFARQIIKPISAINAQVNTITASDLGQRLPASVNKDEIAQLTTTFNTMLDRLETAFELQSNFISNASHELRTPLTAILGESEVILSAPRSTTEYVDSIRAISDEAKKLDELTSSLLRLCQISFDGKKQKLEMVMMDEVLMGVKILLDKRAPGNMARILIQTVDAEPEGFALMCVRNWIEVAIMNIILNSIKYSDNKEVLVTLTGNNQHFMIRISDDGIGIPADELPHILQPFFRGRNTVRYDGFGIGLPLAARIVKLHSGTFEVISREGSGTQVTLKFPVVATD